MKLLTSRVPTTAQLRDPSMTWRHLVVIVPRTELTVTTTSGVTHTVNASMTPQGILDAEAAARNYADMVGEWSGGAAAINMDVVVADGDAITGASQIRDGNQFWVSPNDARGIIEKYAAPGTYHNVTVIWRDEDGAGNKIPTGAYGWTAGGGPGQVADAGYSVVTTPDNDAPWAGTYPGEVFVHEWLHQVESYARAARVPLPSLHANAEYGVPRPTAGSWRAWYEGYMQGTLVGPDGKSAGMTPNGWATIAARFPRVTDPSSPPRRPDGPQPLPSDPIPEPPPWDRPPEETHAARPEA